MGLINASVALGYLKTYRVVHIDGRYGGGKTALAYRLAYELLEQGFAKYLVSNVKSIWNDDPAQIQLTQHPDGQLTADVVAIIDEGGLFLKLGYDADKYLAFLRKLNIVLIIPSVRLPARDLRYLTIYRAFNAQIVGVPAWFYRLDLARGKARERDYFVWTNPSEIFGIYDTLGFPSDDAGLSDYVKRWTDEAASKAGYERPQAGGFVFNSEANTESSTRTDGQSDTSGSELLEEIRRVAAAVTEGADAQQEVVSFLTERESGRKGRR